MDDSYFKGTPWRHFMKFISPAADRFIMLKELLAEAALEYSVLTIAGSRHLVVAPSPSPDHGSQPAGRHPSTMLVAHYDRAEGSPGANDNSTGVFLLIETAIRLKEKRAKNWLVIFTDKEELKTGESLQAQGAYSLAAGLKTARVKKSRIFCFDACGTGDTMIISTTLESLLKKEGGGKKLRESIMELRTFAQDTAKNLKMAKVFLAPTPFSDDAGFFRAGLAAQTITMLPSNECLQLFSELSKNQGFADALISARPRQSGNADSIPETWRSLNGPGDSHLRLTPEHFRTVVDFAEALCGG